jgi:hypothetical protein
MRNADIPAILNENEVTNPLAPLRQLAGRWFHHRNAPATVGRSDQNYLDLIQCLSEGVKVRFITSFPRSGNTWVRYLLSDVFLQLAGVETKTVLPIHPDKVIPDIYTNSIAGREPGITPGLLIKTHEGFDRLKKRIPAPAFQQCKHVYIYRSPEDSLVSFYHLHLRDENLKDKVRQGIDAFCRARVREWISNVTSYLRAAQTGAQVYFVSYELLLDQTGPALSGMLHWLGVEHQESMVERAVSNMQFEKMRTEKVRLPANRGASSERGRPGGGAAELKAATLARIRQETADVLTQANQLLSCHNETRGNGSRELCGHL